MVKDFYDELAPYYHLLYPDWQASIDRQAAGLGAVLTEFGVTPGAHILDAACGIGTQCLGLAAVGYDVSASDISIAAVRRAEDEAARRSLRLAFSVADLRELSTVHTRRFDAVVVCDNAIPHLLSDAEILRAIEECRYYAVGLATLNGLVLEAGFVRAERRDSFFFQPLLVGINAN